MGKPIPSPVVLGQVTEKFRQAVRVLTEREGIPLYQFDHKERKDDVANHFRRQREIRDGVVFVGLAQEKAQAFQGRKSTGSSCSPARSGNSASAERNDLVLAVLRKVVMDAHLHGFPFLPFRFGGNG